MSSPLASVYIGYTELVEYLKQRQNKSFWGFLLRYRDVVVDFSMSSSVTSCWQDLDNFWTRKFLKEAEELDHNSFHILNEKVRLFI